MGAAGGAIVFSCFQSFFPSVFEPLDPFEDDEPIDNRDSAAAVLALPAPALLLVRERGRPIAAVVVATRWFDPTTKGLNGGGDRGVATVDVAATLPPPAAAAPVDDVSSWMFKVASSLPARASISGKAPIGGNASMLWCTLELELLLLMKSSEYCRFRLAVLEVLESLSSHAKVKSTDPFRFRNGFRPYDCDNSAEGAGATTTVAAGLDVLTEADEAATAKFPHESEP